MVSETITFLEDLLIPTASQRRKKQTCAPSEKTSLLFLAAGTFWPTYTYHFLPSGVVDHGVGKR